jgi:hypothetical protein
MKGNHRLLLMMPLLAIALFGCQTMTHDDIKAKVDMPPTALEKPEFIFHKVMAGETMATIARWYTGKESQWRLIAEKNPGMDPWRLKKDDIVKVPVVIATAHKEQPNFSTVPRRKPKKGAATGKPGEAAEEASEGEDAVFGPR